MTDPPSIESPPVERSFAELLDELFDRRRHPSGRKYMYDEMVTAMPGDASPQHISQLRTGKIKNPGWKIIQGLCIFFDVPPEYFFPVLQGVDHKPLPPAPDEG